MRETRAALAVLVLGLLLLGGAGTARADHSLGRPCLSCHALRSTGVEPGSRNILLTAVADALYQTDFYCGPKWVGGEPLDCSYCHGSAGDVANEIALAAGGANGSAHPVDVGGDSASYGTALRITCNDCHHGDTDNVLNPGADLTPDALCSKIAIDGYPNHHSTVLGGTDPGSNNLADNPPRLTAPYGPQGGALSSGGGVDWTGGADRQLDSTELLCFRCHDGSPNPPFSTGITATDIATDYNAPGGGHNMTYAGVGTLAGKLPCYDCHDPHAATGTDNESLILNGEDAPVNPYGTSTFATAGYTGANDRVVCAGCHVGAHVVEAVSAPDISDPVATIEFPFHANVHTGVLAAGNCLQKNGGCHQGPHNTDFFRCLDCHSTARDPNSHASLAAVDRVDSEFAHIGAVGPGDADANYIASVHTIPYDAAAGSDMSDPAVNGCLYCHGTAGQVSTTGYVLATTDAAPAYFTAVTDAFCLSCHDGDPVGLPGLTVQGFEPNIDYDLSAGGDGNGTGTITYNNAGETLAPPQVNDNTSGTTGRYFDVGHGRTGSYVSGNADASLPCVACHLYHGSTAYKLLPGWRVAKDATNVVKTLGGVSSSKIDYYDYSDPANNSRIAGSELFRSQYVSEYTGNWNTYIADGWSDATPAGTVTAFGTSGDMRPNASSSDEMTCNQTVSTANKVGFCNACHLDDTATASTTGRAYTHEGSPSPSTDCNGQSLDSHKNFFKDCVECHDPHGSGGSGTDNIYMVRSKVKHGDDPTNAANWGEVTFVRTTGVDSYDENDGASESNGDDLCAVCHVRDPAAPVDDANTPDTLGVGHNYRTFSGVADHNQGGGCVSCHTHGLERSLEDTRNQGKIGFKRVQCSECHGSIATGQYWPDSNPLAAYEDRAGAHDQHVAALARGIYGESAAELLTDFTPQNPALTSHAKQLAVCSVCHPNPGDPRAGTGEASHLTNAAPVDTADLHGDGRTGATASNYQTITGAAQSLQGTYDSGSGANGKDCSNIDCHYREDTPTTGTPAADGDGWYNPAAAATCDNCHGSRTAGAILPNAHQAHVGTPGGAPGAGFDCAQCHPDHGADTSHQQGTVDLTFAATSWEPGAIPGSQAGSDLAVKFGGAGGYATCSNFYCHGSELNNGGTDQTPLWSDFTTGNCGTCHGVFADPVAQGRAAGLAVTSGNHLTHYTAARGPGLDDAHGSSTGCYQCHNSVDPAAHAPACTDCHPIYFDVGLGANVTAGATAPGASNPTASHVDGKTDFGNTDQTTATQSVLGTTAPLGPPDATSTDRCNNCHSTEIASGQSDSGTVQVKSPAPDNWSNPLFLLDCETCHNTPAGSAWSKADGAAAAVPVAQAPAKTEFFATRGHGLATTADYPWPDGGPGRSGAEAACLDCHTGSGNHISHALGDTDRLTTAGNTLCNSCHDGAGGGPAVSQVSTHANTSSTMPAGNPAYNPQEAAFELNCIECHDVHGTANIFMINAADADGPLVGTRLYNGAANTTSFLFDGTPAVDGAVAFTDDSVGTSSAAGVGYADTAAGGNPTKICQTCHTQTGHYQFDGNDGHFVMDCIPCHKHDFDDDFGAGSQDGFMPIGCDGCHGDQTTGQYWPDGLAGDPPYVDDEEGSHGDHVEAISQYLWGEATATLLTDTGNGTSHDKQVQVCAFCHPDPGGSGHLIDSGDGRVDLYGGTGAGDYFQVFLNGAGVSGDDTHTVATYDAVARTCANLDCHYETTTPLYNDTPATGIGWDGGNEPAHVPDCETCHFYRDGGAYPTVENWSPVTPQLPDAHQVHVAGIAPPSDDQSKAYPCGYCHVVPAATAHTNGQLDLDLTGSPRANADESATQANLAVKYGAGVADATCSGVYCHGADFDATTQGVDVTPVWNDQTTGTCGDCHDINTESVAFKQPLTQGAHEVHMAQLSGAAYGPGIGSHARYCSACHGRVDPLGGGDCQPCHASGFIMPGNPGDAGFAWAASASHVEGAFEVDFADQDRGWNWPGDAFTGAGTLAVLGTAFDNGTDICNRCHSTALVGGDVGGTLAKQQWTGVAHALPCENCHNDTDPAFSTPVSGGLQAPEKTSNFTTRGHGLSSSSTYPWSSGRSGAGALCTDCHDDSAAHVSAASGDTDRLTTAGNALCDSCHDGPGGGPAVSQVSTHANTSTTMTNVYTAQRAAMELNCIECHDVHGSANIFMVNEVNPDGPLVATRLYNGGADTTSFLFNGDPVAFTDDSVGTSTTVGVGYADPSTGPGNYTSRICQTCHTQTVHYELSTNDGHVLTDCITCHKHEFDDNYAPNSQDGFMPSGCDGCHGFPPVPVAATTPPEENYTGGGGAHQQHVDFLTAQLAIPPTEVQGRAQELCGPCHGQDPLGDHAASGEAAGTWNIGSRAQVNLVARTASSWGAAGTYGGSSVAAPGTNPPGNSVDTTDSRCANLDCHGSAATEILHWNVDTAADTAGDPEDGLEKSQVCEGCHDQTPAQVRVYPAGVNPPATYTGNAPDAAANYYQTISGYGRGGHGDAEIQNEDPGVNSDPGHVTPIDCTACHADAAEHFPAVAGDLHRLGANATLETTSHTGAGLCNSCHDGATYPGPGNHHPSLRGTASNGTRNIVVSAASQEIRTAVSGTTSWVDGSGGSCGIGDDFCEQDAYGAANFSGNPDFYVDGWGGNPGDSNQSPPPQPSPFAVLPLLQYVGNQSGLTNAVMCVTCHNPHGTDLYVFDPGGIGSSISDNNMLRVRDSDNSLCNACH
jgi:predicted CxxxxCH...CXXCH cytochrome family protein